MIKVVDSKKSYDKNSDLYIGTHNGIFHCDEVIAISILDILFNDIRQLYVIRSRNLDFLNENCNILVDIGGGEFDHHQKNGNGIRDNGIQYASAGLVWKKFGFNLLELLSDNKLDKNDIEHLFNKIDNDIIQNIDLEDNGQFVSSHNFQYISSFLPLWYNLEKQFDAKFEECINLTSKILRNIINNYNAYRLAEKEIYNRINNKDTFIDNMLLLPSQSIPWTNIVISYNDESSNKIDFVIYPYPDGGYAIQCVPPSLDEMFAQRIPFPECWAGETEKLKEISGIGSAVLCHRGRFFARALEYEDIIKMGIFAKIENENQKLIYKK